MAPVPSDRTLWQLPIARAEFTERLDPYTDDGFGYTARIAFTQTE
jgi:hypothetical protein